ncbi:nitroreductase family deazaflavin-dependent oxidoreductase [Nocardia sp. ET3-3]|uniref:Nitroreductase family deazaflavin-dependent oxidoreductase n=1 Tax=Nocardia terrae TaxID=2675851 RepID=A0A7K1V171_9NOCA|nr:nitroreductase family deazaflavin-dependent oxidoreductase [Nocardia terrae]MVU80393.1 nitroreductase family deazaflavin-dependent oxidoreductase [Nocardia terrae]
MTFTGAEVDFDARPSRTSWLSRAPIPLYRAGLGSVLGSGRLMLRHSGLTRYAILRVADRPQPDRIVALPEIGDTQWLLAIRADPCVRVWIGDHRDSPATATPITAEQAGESLERYIDARTAAQRRPHAAIAPLASSMPIILLEFDGPGIHRTRTS